MPPAVALAVAATASVVGAGYSIYQGEKAKTEAKRAGRARADELRKEADVARERGRRLLGRQRAQYGAAGVDPGYGTPLLVQGQTLYDTMLEQERLIRASRNAYRDARRQGAAYRAEGIAGGVAGLGQAAGIVASPEFQSAYFTPADESPS